jgi:hypothetical protein
MPPRISLATLIGIVAVIALGLAGMLSTSRLWLMLASTVALALLLAALLASWLFCGEERAFWVGFALFGWTYLILVNWDWVGGQIGHDLTVGFNEAAEWLLPQVRDPGLQFGVATLPPGTSTMLPGAPGQAVPVPRVVVREAEYFELVRRRHIKLGNFVQICRIMGALCFGVLGGWLARTMAQREEKRRAELTASPG